MTSNSEALTRLYRERAQLLRENQQLRAENKQLRAGNNILSRPTQEHAALCDCPRCKEKR